MAYVLNPPPSRVWCLFIDFAREHSAGYSAIREKKKMIDSIYDFLNSLGYPHPIHPTEVHMPIGLVVGGLIFSVIAVLFHRKRLALTPRQCILLAFIWVFPTMLFGYMDWQQFYGGTWLQPIKVKLVVAPVLTLLLFFAMLLGRRYGATSLKVIPVYFLCFCCVVVLGYYGGQLVYGGRAAPSSAEFKAGEMIFRAKCSACHPGGGNALVPGKPILHSHKLQDLITFVQWVRDPKAPMPAFPARRISDTKVRDLYEYITKVLNTQTG
jgi:uncharacterized membrane protein